MLLTKIRPHDYYFLANSLPPLQLGLEPELSFEEFIFLLRENVSHGDIEKAKVVQRYYDLQNLQSHWMGMQIDSRGFLKHDQIEEALINGEGLPEYVQDFLGNYEGKGAYIKAFPRLIALYFQNEIPLSSGFLTDYLDFERKWRLVFCGFRTKKMSGDLLKELRFEDPYDPLVVQLIAQKDAKAFEPPFGFEELKKIFDFDDPFDLHKAICEYRFSKVDALTEGENFSFNFILAYMTKLIVVEKWYELDKLQGLELIENIVKERS